MSETPTNGMRNIPSVPNQTQESEGKISPCTTDSKPSFRALSKQGDAVNLVLRTRDPAPEKTLGLRMAETEKSLGLYAPNHGRKQIDELKAHKEEKSIFDVAKEARETGCPRKLCPCVFVRVQCPTAKWNHPSGATSCYVGDNTDIIIKTGSPEALRKK